MVGRRMKKDDDRRGDRALSFGNSWLKAAAITSHIHNQKEKIRKGLKF